MAIEMLTENTGYIKSLEGVELSYLERFTNVGLIFSENGVILIDTGWGEKQAKAVLSELEGIKKRPVAIVNTHTHLDHAGGNRYIIDKTGCPVYCTLYESLMITGEENLFQVMFNEALLPLPGGTEDFGTLKKTEPVIIEPDSQLEIDGVCLEIIGLPGHSNGHVGISHDGVLFAGDALTDAEAARRNKVSYISDPAATRRSLARIRASSYSFYVPSHGKHFIDPTSSVDCFLAMMNRVERAIKEAAKRPVCLDDMIKYVSDSIDLHLSNLPYYDVAKVMVHTMANTLVWDGALVYKLKDNVLYYSAVREDAGIEKE